MLKFFFEFWKIKYYLYILTYYWRTITNITEEKQSFYFFSQNIFHKGYVCLDDWDYFWFLVFDFRFTEKIIQLWYVYIILRVFFCFNCFWIVYSHNFFFHVLCIFLINLYCFTNYLCLSNHKNVFWRISF